MKYPTQEEILELSPEERIQLIEEVWDTLAADLSALPLSEEHRRELDQRLREMEKSPGAETSWPELRWRIERR
ncbi:MAG TPA: addiction module protein [Bryobacteraceae bacterium]|nr:addiction module protein [Bryobacteraceae bacterium]